MVKWMVKSHENKKMDGLNPKKSLKIPFLDP
jgi:hypothetical protein